MEVIVYSTLSSTPGQVTIATSPDDTINSLIAAFCVEKGIRQRRNFVVRNQNQEVLHSVSRLYAADVKNGDVLYLGYRAENEHWLFGCNQWWLLACVALLIGGAGIIAVSILKVNGNKAPSDYGIVIDAGSSHSKLFVYRWPGPKDDGTAIAQQIHTCENDRGISSYTDNPDQAGPSLVPCLNEAEQAVPTSSHWNTMIYLGATAGMRLLEQSDNETCQIILSSVRQTIGGYSFSFLDPLNQARIISGQEEGSFSWITANFLSGNFGKNAPSSQAATANQVNPSTTVGALDMGGASTQITFSPADTSILGHNESETLLLYGETYLVYTHSCLCYGLNEGLRQLKAHLVTSQNFSSVIENPCAPEGTNITITFDEVFEAPCTRSRKPGLDRLAEIATTTYQFVGTSDSVACHARTSEIYNTSVSIVDPPCILNPPALHGDFLAFSGFYYNVAFFNLSEDFTHAEYEQARDAYCNKTWDEVSKIPAKEKKPDERLVACFDGHFIDVLLTDNYGFTDKTWDTLHFSNDIDGTDLGWSLGFMLNASNTIPPSYPSKPVSTSLFIVLIILFIFFVFIAFGFACYARRQSSQSGRPQHHRLSTYGAL